MTDEVPLRLRMFAGPNGAGKTSLVQSLAREFTPDGAFHVHHYINADDLRLTLTDDGLDFATFGLKLDRRSVTESLLTGGRLASSHPTLSSVKCIGSKLQIHECDAYTAAAVADFLRDALLTRRQSFAFETVMSHRSKVEFFRSAAETGYRTYLYFIATRSPELNVSRVSSRVELGGHDVPAEKIRARYHRSLDLLPEAMKSAHRAFVFDNSVGEPQWLAEQLPDKTLELKVPEKLVPEWFRERISL